MILKNTVPEARGKSTHLVVAIHGWAGSSSSLEHIRAAITEAVPDADLLFPDYPAGLFSNVDPIEVTEALVRCIADAVKVRESSGQAYDGITLIGHSLGALLVRKAYVFARGQNQDHSGYLRPTSQPWGNLVQRIILLAGTNRGWELRQKARGLSFPKWLAFLTCSELWHWFHLSRLINSAREGAPFVANLRIQWINLLRDSTLSPPVPTTIQLLGTVDDIVDERDNVDIQCGSNFVYKSVPESGHIDVINFLGAIGSIRSRIFVDALITDVRHLRSDMLLALDPEPDVQKVIFIMHGIRDYGYWTLRLAKTIREASNRAATNVKIITSDYGYFPIVGFLLQPERQKNVRWFMDQYTEALARYPNAGMSFIGHSNGTYLLASALERYPACNFERVVFAGSVVNRQFRWDKHFGESRLTALQNYVATADWVVAIFPAIFERLRGSRSDLGSAGHSGFAFRDPPVFEITFIRGGHGAAIVSENFESIADFVLGNDSAAPKADLTADSQSTRVTLGGKFCLHICIVLLVVALLPLWIFPLLSTLGLSAWPYGWKFFAILCGAWLLFLYSMLLRF